ncbi:response regulator transcription factor [soil metagenome]
MIVIVDERQLVTCGYEASFDREGVASMGFSAPDFSSWVDSAASSDIDAVEAFLLGDCSEIEDHAVMIRSRSFAPVIALNENPGLEHTLKLFAAGVDDVVRKPVHVREILARAEAIRRRRLGNSSETRGHVDAGDIRVFSDGRDPVVGGEVLLLPRRERRILEYLVGCRGRLVTKSQIFSAIYGLFDEDVQENVIESHISKLRKKLRGRLGFDPVESKRYLGYRLIAEPHAGKANGQGAAARRYDPGHDVSLPVRAFADEMAL